MAVTIEFVSSGLFEGGLALKLFRALELIREKYGIEILLDFVNESLSGSSELECSPRLSVGSRIMYFRREDVESIDVNSLASEIVKLVFGKGGEALSLEIPGIESGKPEALPAATAS